MALIPDAVFYLRIQSPQELVERVLSSGRGFDYWESGMDLYLGEDLYDSFVEYQKRLLTVFDRMSAEYQFHVVNSSRSVRSVASDLRRAVAKLIDEAKQPLEGVATNEEALDDTSTQSTTSTLISSLEERKKVIM